MPYEKLLKWQAGNLPLQSTCIGSIKRKNLKDKHLAFSSNVLPKSHLNY
jgi:hypothetical protein